MRPSRKQDLIDTAARLFDERGFTATGIDAIIESAGAAKMTLYNNFGSKEALAAAALDTADRAFRERVETALTKVVGGPRDKLVALFDILEAWFRDEDFHGCLFMKSAAEYPDPASPVRKAALAHKAWLLSLVKKLASEAGADDPTDLAGQIFLLMEGATTVAHQTGDVTAAPRAKVAAETLIDAALD
jgi:AcrR family transcriptional regulator